MNTNPEPPRNKFALIGRCAACRRIKFWLKSRTIKLPVGGTVKGGPLLCTPCAEALQAKISKAYAE